MKSILSYLLIILISIAPLAFGQKHIANGDQFIRGNRLISAQSEPGKQLHLSFKKMQNGPISIELDGKKSESQWKTAQKLAPFSDEKGNIDRSTALIMQDQSHIYLFWEIHEPDGIVAHVEKTDSVLTGDSYVQVNLHPLLPDSIKYGRNYYYSIVVNPQGTVWDSYFDPYSGGYFFSSWRSRVEVATTANGKNWTAEMIIPFSGLDHSSNPGWQWQVQLFHASQMDRQNAPKISGLKTGVTVEQGIMVRREQLVQYYWTRPEFMEEVKPEARIGFSEAIGVVDLKNLPEDNDTEDSALWQSVKSTNINYHDESGEKLTEHSARFKAGQTGNYLCFNLHADGAKTVRAGDLSVTGGRGMKGQTVGVNGVFVDDALFANECFWLIIQPRDPVADKIHQNYYLIIINNLGEIDGIHYDQYGTPDRSWEPTARLDVYNTNNGWGAEVSIDLSSFDLPANSGDSWGLNVFRNRIISYQPRKSELQAWLYTGKAFLNPEKFGAATNLHLADDSPIRAGLKRMKENIRRKIDDHDEKYQAEMEPLRAKLNQIDVLNDRLTEIETRLEEVDHSLGIIDTKIYDASYPHITKGGNALFDIQFIGRHGWAVGAMGTILRSEDGGKSWQRVDMETDADFYRVRFANKNEGWAAGGRIRMGNTNEAMRHDARGGYGYIYHTDDGGKTWTCQYGHRGRNIFGLDFIDEKTGFACGELGFLLHTDDGGEHWRVMPNTGTLHWLYGIDFKDEKTGFIIGESEIVLRTRDAGKSWEKVHALADRQFYGFRPFYRDVTFNGNTGCIVGQNGSVLMSYDGGETWTPSATFFQNETRELMDLTRVDFVTKEQGYIVGELGTRILWTDDGGASWALRPVENEDWLRALWADADGKIFVTGEQEKIIMSDDFGKSWRTVRGTKPKTDVMVLLAHGDDSAIHLGAFFAHYAINEGKDIVDIEVLRDAHSVEYEGEIYNLEHHRDVRMSGVQTTTYFDEFENGNNGCDYYHFTTRLWEGEENVTRHMVAAIRAYRPDVVIIHGPVFGDYDKPGHKVSGRSGIPAFETSGGDVDHWKELTRAGLPPWQAKKLYCLASESYPMTLDLAPLSDIPLKGTDGTCGDWAEFVIRNFQSQGVYHARKGKLCLIKSLVDVPESETSVFNGLK